MNATYHSNVKIYTCTNFILLDRFQQNLADTIMSTVYIQAKHIKHGVLLVGKLLRHIIPTWQNKYIYSNQLLK